MAKHFFATAVAAASLGAHMFPIAPLYPLYTFESSLVYISRGLSACKVCISLYYLASFWLPSPLRVVDLLFFRKPLESLYYWRLSTRDSTTRDSTTTRESRGTPKNCCLM